MAPSTPVDQGIPLRAIVIDDDREMRTSCAELLKAFDWEVKTLPGAARLTDTFNEFPADVVLTDVRMPTMNGMDLLRSLKSVADTPPVVLFTAHGDIPMAVEAMRHGAYEFMEKPYDAQRLLSVLRRAAEFYRTQRSADRLRAHLSSLTGFDRVFLGRSPQIVELRRQVMSLLDASTPIMIRGETGTGKRLLARMIHNLGAHADAPFVEVNCAQIVPEHAVEMLCGVENVSTGMLDEIGMGTLFGSEIAVCPQENQVKLLQLAETGTYLPIGASTSRVYRGRFITSTNADIEASLAEGAFRSDLYYRLSGLTLHVPPLRERLEDVPILFASFLEEFAKTYAERVPGLGTDGIAALLAHEWRGNVRELRQVAERWVLRRRVNRDVSVEEAIGAGIVARPKPITLREATAVFEADMIFRAIVRSNGRMDEVADSLGIPRRTLNDKMLKLGISKDAALNTG